MKNQNQSTKNKSQMPGASQGFVPNDGGRDGKGGTAKAERPNTTREDQDLDGSDVNGDERQKSQNERDKQRQST